MSLLLDARTGRKPTGIGQYVLALARELSMLDPERLVFASTRRHSADLVAAGARTVVVEDGEDLAAAFGSYRVRLVHGPNYHAPHIGNAVRVATIHDLGFIDFPETQPLGMSERLDRIIRQTTRGTSMFLCDSQWTLERFQHRYHVDAARCAVVHLGISERFAPQVRSPMSLGVRAHAIRRPYLLHVGAMIKRKDLGTLMRAFEIAARQHPDLNLVLVGNKTRRWASAWPEVRAWLRNHPRLRLRVRVLNYVPDRDMPALYSGAAVIVSTSLLEGFGLTILEGLASGVPVVATEGSAVSEVAGDHPFYGIARDAESYANAITRALDAPEARRAAGVTHASQYTWRATATRTLAVYDRVLSD